MKAFIQMARQPSYGVAVLFAISGILFFSTKSIFIKKAYVYGVDPVTLMFLRMLMAAPVYVAIFYLNKNAMQTLSGRDLLFTLMTGIVGYYIASFMDLQGLLYISASLERMILYLFPSFVLLISVLFYKHKLAVVELFAFIFSYLGIFIVYAQDFSSGGSEISLGAGLVLASAVAFALFVVSSGRLIARIGAGQFTSISMLGASVAIVLHYSVYQLGDQVPINSYQGEVYGYAFVLAIFCTVLPSYLVNIGIKHIGATKAALLSTCSPMITIALAYVFLNESYGQYHIYGFILVMLGMSMITMKKSGSGVNE